MASMYNVYCDESCHLENDRQEVMVLGAVWCPLRVVKESAKEIRAIKAKNGLPTGLEIKWVKVSPAKVGFYLSLVDYFFSTKSLGFRAVVIRDKQRLRHTDFQQTHDDWYYKMYFTLLKQLAQPSSQFRIYLDIKDTHSHTKCLKLQDVLRNNLHDFKGQVVERVQPVRSGEVVHIQLADLLIGALSYVNRNLHTSKAKNVLVERIGQLSGKNLMQSTAVNEQKFNLFFWRPQKANQ